MIKPIVYTHSIADWQKQQAANAVIASGRGMMGEVLLRYVSGQEALGLQ